MNNLHKMFMQEDYRVQQRNQDLYYSVKSRFEADDGFMIAATITGYRGS